MGAQKKARETGAGLWSPETERAEQKENTKAGLWLTIDLKESSLLSKTVLEEPIDLTGYVLVSIVENQRFTVPSIELKSGETVTVISGRNARDEPPEYLLWTKKYIWNDDGDLTDPRTPNGKLVAIWP